VPYWIRYLHQHHTADTTARGAFQVVTKDGDAVVLAMLHFGTRCIVPKDPAAATALQPINVVWRRGTDAYLRLCELVASIIAKSPQIDHAIIIQAAVCALLFGGCDYWDKQWLFSKVRDVVPCEPSAPTGIRCPADTLDAQVGDANVWTCCLSTPVLLQCFPLVPSDQATLRALAEDDDPEPEPDADEPASESKKATRRKPYDSLDPMYRSTLQLHLQRFDRLFVFARTYAKGTMAGKWKPVHRFRTLCQILYYWQYPEEASERFQNRMRARKNLAWRRTATEQASAASETVNEGEEEARKRTREDGAEAAVIATRLKTALGLSEPDSAPASDRV
jgi:hypothetical protein